MSMAFGLFTLLAALTMSGLAAWYSIQGLISIYTGMPLIVMLLAGIIEIGKLVAASWVYQTWNWSKAWIRGMLSVMIVGVMVVTSIGIYGLLNKAHQDTLAKSDTDILQITRIDDRIASEKSKIARLNVSLGQLDKAIQIYFDKEYITRGLREREKQAPLRRNLNIAIDEHNTTIDSLIDKKQPLLSKLKTLEHEIGPLKAIAELIYGEENARDYFDNAVRWLTILLVVIFDPFAVLLVIAANMSLTRSRGPKGNGSVADKIVENVIDKVAGAAAKKKSVENNTSSLSKEAKTEIESKPLTKEEERIIIKRRKALWYDRWKKKQEIDFEHVDEEVIDKLPKK